MQCSESAKPVKAVQHDVTCTMKAKFDSLNVIKIVSNRKQTFLACKEW